MILFRWRCRSCDAPWASSMPGETRCPFCGSQDIEGPINARRDRIMDVQRNLGTKRKRPLDSVRGGAYLTSGMEDVRASLAPHADAGKARPSSAPSAQAPHRPSEGLLQTRPCSLSPCPDDRNAGQCRSRGRDFSRRGATGRLPLREVGGKGLTASSRRAATK